MEWLNDVPKEGCLIMGAGAGALAAYTHMAIRRMAHALRKMRKDLGW